MNGDKNLRQRFCLKKNLNAPRPSDHPPVRGKNVKTFRWDHRLQIQNLLLLCFNKLVLCGGDSKYKLTRLEMAEHFFSKRVRFARADEAVGLPLPVKHRHQRMWRFY